MIEEEARGRCKLLFMITVLRGEQNNKRGFVFCDRDYFGSGSIEDMDIRNCYMQVDISQIKEEFIRVFN